MPDADAMIELLNGVQYVFLRSLAEPRDNSLVLVVEEASLNRSEQRRKEIGDDLPRILRDSGLKTEAYSIESTENCKTFRLYWKRYAAYLVTEELVGSNAPANDEEIYKGRLLRRYTKSHFLDHIERDTGGHIDPVQHFKLICLNHLIDVAAYGPPEIDLIADLPHDNRWRVS